MATPESIVPDLQEIIDLIAESIITGKKQLADGFQYTDIFAFVPVLSKIPEAIKDANKAWEYLQNMDETRRNDLIDAVLAKLKDASEETRTWARRIVDALASNYMLVKLIMDKASKGGPATGLPGGANQKSAPQPGHKGVNPNSPV